MLNFDVKRKINTLRDILVGKVPDPKAQVEQITIALIYKFMDDMDLQAMDFGGARTFFTEEYKKYAFSQIMLPENNANERLNLYAEGIDKMSNNPNLPQLFREILRNTYIPYRDPETLNRFLKEINEFTYDDSEDLGNAFEYLLSIMGSQGDAGQFRTPRHIIDMMVEITAPRKDETILDPACGTAGFLISAYKYIQEQNKDKDGNSTLGPEDKNRLMQNFAGYDISPDMVRLSRVNMYLHGFVNPNISEYDTLTSEEKWTDYYDVIFANPPFMTPKGGITPHSRYRVSAKRSEVLFVDYIAEHLNPNGRAAIIVPEGIVFQSQTAYKKLRQFLVDEGYLYAVISLPAGVFNPYSGVKTSILLIDRKIAKQHDDILFVKLNNDGFDLGAQRREIKGSEIPEVISIFRDYQKGGSVERRDNVVLAKKTDITKQDFILVGERYSDTIAQQTLWPQKTIGDLCAEIKAGFACGNSSKDGSGILHVRPMNITPEGQFSLAGSKYISEEELPEEYKLNTGDILFNNTNSKELVGKTCYYSSNINAGFSNHITRLRVNEQVLPQYMALILQSMFEHGVFLRMCNKWVGQAAVNVKTLSMVTVPVPPITVQEEIVAEIEGYQKIIDGARQVVDNYKPTIKIDPSWKKVDIGTMYDISYGVTLSIPQCLDDNGIKIVSTAEVGLDGSLDLTNIRRVKYETKFEKYILEPNTLLFNWRNAPKHVGKTALFMEEDEKYISASFLLSLKNKNPDKYDNKYIWCALNNLRETGYFMRNARQAVNQSNFNGDQLGKTFLPVPPIDIQKKIVAQINEEMAIVAQNKRLIEIFQQKIKDRIAEVWGENQ